MSLHGVPEPAELASAAGHALAGPVAVIAGFAHVIGSRGTDEHVRSEAAGNIVAAAHRLLQVHEDVLTLLAAAVGGGEARGRSIPATRLVRDAFGLTARGAGGEIRPEISGAAGASVPGDLLLVRAVSNLVVGACEGRGLPLVLPVVVGCDGSGLVSVDVLLGAAPCRSDRWSLSLGAASYILSGFGARVDVVDAADGWRLRITIPEARAAG